MSNIWGTFVFAKPLGRCVQTLRDALPAEHLPAMSRLIQTLDEYLQATDERAQDVFRKAIGRQRGGVLPFTDTASPSLTDGQLRVIFKQHCKLEVSAEQWTELCKFAHAIEASVRLADDEIATAR